MSGDGSGLQGGGLFVSWELDLWGRVRYERAAAEQQYASVAADVEYARQSVAALVAKGWFLAAEARLLPGITSRTARGPRGRARQAATFLPLSYPFVEDRARVDRQLAP